MELGCSILDYPVCRRPWTYAQDYDRQWDRTWGRKLRGITGRKEREEPGGGTKDMVSSH